MTAAPTPAVRPDRIAFGIVMVLASTLFTAAQEATFKFASTDMSIWQVYVMRSALLIPVLLVIAAVWGGGVAVWRAGLQVWPLLRGLSFVCMYFSMHAVLHLVPLSAIAAGVYTAPLFVAVLSPVLLNERVGWKGWLAILIGFGGVLVILRPGGEGFAWAMLLPVAGGLFYALSAIITRRKCRAVPPAAMAIALAVVLLVTGAIASIGLIIWQPTVGQVGMAPFLFSGWGALGATGWVVILVLTGLMVGNGLVLPAAYQSAPTVIIATFDYCYLIFVTVLAYLLFDEFPDGPTLLGMCLIALAGLIVTRR